MPPFTATHGIGTLPTLMPNDIIPRPRCTTDARQLPSGCHALSNLLQYKTLSRPKSLCPNRDLQWPMSVGIISIRPVPSHSRHPVPSRGKRVGNPSNTRPCTCHCAPTPLIHKSQKLHTYPGARYPKTVMLIIHPTPQQVLLKNPSGHPSPGPDHCSQSPVKARLQRPGCHLRSRHCPPVAAAPLRFHGIPGCSRRLGS